VGINNLDQRCIKMMDSRLEVVKADCSKLRAAVSDGRVAQRPGVREDSEEKIMSTTGSSQ
jgi:hypothetical protein